MQASRNQRIRIYVVGVFFLALFAMLIYRLFILATDESERLIANQRSQVEVVRDIHPPRGDIIDRRGRPLAKDTPLVRVVVDPKLFHLDWCLFDSPNCTENESERAEQIQEEKYRLTTLAKALELDEAQLIRDIRENPRRRFKVIAREVPPHLLANVSEVNALSPHVFVENYYRRFYPLKDETSTLLGFVNHEGEGVSGIEKEYNAFLASSPGKVLEKYAGRVGLRKKNGKRERYVFYSEEIEPSKEGQTLQLTIESYLQHQSYQHLKDDTLKFNATSASAVILDVETGEILTLTDFPGTNTNDRSGLVFDRTISTATTKAYEPGSAMKSLVLAKLLDEGLLDRTEQIDTSPGYTYLDKWLVKDARNYGLLTAEGILAKSSNVGMIELTKRLTGEDFSLFLNQLGLNETSGALPGIEAVGNLGNAWESEVTKLNQSYGYSLEFSALAFARAYLTLARDGELIPLTLLKQSRSLEPKQIFKPSTAKTVRGWMEKVTLKGGTGTRAANGRVSVAGKTGTARITGFQLDENEFYNTMFVGMLPADKPKVLILVAFKNVTGEFYSASTSAATTFKKISEDVITFLDIYER